MSSPVFSRTDTTTDSETFYSSILDLFDDQDEHEEVKELLAWWNRLVLLPSIVDVYSSLHASQIFPNYSAARRPIAKHSALARIKARRVALKSTINNINMAEG
jgi:hypothetical protein